MITIQVQNISSVCTDEQLAGIYAAIEAQVAEDVGPIWNCQGIKFLPVPKGQAMAPDKWQFVVADTSDQAGAAGYHETDNLGWPIGYAFVKTTLDAGMHPSVTISHEVLEMIGDALIDQSNQWSDLPNAIFLAQELCDPVEDDQFGYEKNGVLVSDFVTPAYFVPKSVGPWDFRSYLKGPWDQQQMLAGAYQLVWTPLTGWHQIFPAQHATGRALIASLNRYSRGRRRKLVGMARQSA